MPNSSKAQTRKGWTVGATMQGNARLPKHIPPMNEANNAPSETAVEPITNWSI